MQYQDNLAYDLSKFDVEAREEQNLARREKQNKVIEGIRMNARSVSRSGSKQALVITVAIVFAMLFGVNWLNTAADDAARRASDQRAAFAAAEEEYSLLQTRLESKVNTAYVEEYASTELGMAKVANSQINYLSVNTESLIEVSSDGTGTIFDSVSRWFGDLMEYIGL